MTPSEPTGELRQKLMSLTYVCPKGQYAAHCPFATLGGLTHNSREAVLNRMSYGEMLNLFDLVSSCACPADPRNKDVGCSDSST